MVTVLPVNFWHVITLCKSYIIVCIGNAEINTPFITQLLSSSVSDFKVMGDFIQRGQGENSQVRYLKCVE